MIIEQGKGKDSNSKSKRRSRSRPSSPSRSRSSYHTPPSASLLDGELVTDREPTSSITSLFEDLQISQDSTSNPRSFPYSVKQQCWEKAEKVKGRDPDRWRRDALGNILFRKLVGCPGCLCHDYDHIIPYSKVIFFYYYYYLFFPSEFLSY